MHEFGPFRRNFAQLCVVKNGRTEHSKITFSNQTPEWKYKDDIWTNLKHTFKKSKCAKRHKYKITARRTGLCKLEEWRQQQRLRKSSGNFGKHIYVPWPSLTDQTITIGFNGLKLRFNGTDEGVLEERQESTAEIYWDLDRLLWHWCKKIWCIWCFSGWSASQCSSPSSTCSW